MTHRLISHLHRYKEEDLNTNAPGDEGTIDSPERGYDSKSRRQSARSNSRSIGINAAENNQCGTAIKVGSNRNLGKIIIHTNSSKGRFSGGSGKNSLHSNQSTKNLNNFKLVSKFNRLEVVHADGAQDSHQDSPLERETNISDLLLGERKNENKTKIRFPPLPKNKISLRKKDSIQDSPSDGGPNSTGARKTTIKQSNFSQMKKNFSHQNLPANTSNTTQKIRVSSPQFAFESFNGSQNGPVDMRSSTIKTNGKNIVITNLSSIKPPKKTSEKISERYNGNSRTPKQSLTPGRNTYKRNADKSNKPITNNPMRESILVSSKYRIKVSVSNNNLNHVA